MWKKRMKQIVWSGYCDLRLRALVTGIFALIWWGVLYPELCFTEDTFQQIVVTDGEEKAAEDADHSDILDAPRNAKVIRKRTAAWPEGQL